jgi:hypothetical protein
MSNRSSLSDTAANAEANALAALCNGGVIRYYTGIQPLTGNTAVTGANVLLASATLPNPAWASAIAGVLTANAIPTVAAGVAGVCSFARIIESDGTTVVMDVSAGMAGSGAGVIFSNTAIAAGKTIAVSSLVYNVLEQ